MLQKEWLDHIEFESEVVQVFRSEDGQGGFDICVLQNGGQISLVKREKFTDKEGHVLDKYRIDPSFHAQIEGEFLQHD